MTNGLYQLVFTTKNNDDVNTINNYVFVVENFGK